MSSKNREEPTALWFVPSVAPAGAPGRPRALWQGLVDTAAEEDEEEEDVEEDM